MNNETQNSMQVNKKKMIEKEVTARCQLDKLEEPSCAVRKKGRPRCEKARQAVLDAALELLHEHGCCHHCLTMEAIAKRAGVGKQTVYKWWGGTADILLEILCDDVTEKIPYFHGQNKISLREFLSGTFAAFSPTIKVILKVLMAEAVLNEKFRQKFADELLMRWRLALHGALENSQKHSDADRELIADMIFGFMWYRLLTGIGQLGEKEVKMIAEYVSKNLSGISEA